MKLSRTIIVCAILLSTSVGLGYVHRSENVAPKRPLGQFPTRIGPFTGVIDRFEEQVYEKLGVDDSVLCNYRDHRGNHIQLYIGFHESQREGDLIHSPKHCMPGGGWNIVDTSIVELAVPSRPSQSVKVIRLLLKKGLNKQVILYWYHSRGRVIASEYLQKIYLVVDSIKRNRTDGAFVRLIAPVSGEEQAINEVLENFAIDLFPLLDEYLPS